MKIRFRRGINAFIHVVLESDCEVGQPGIAHLCSNTDRAFTLPQTLFFLKTSAGRIHHLVTAPAALFV